ncbi:MAG: phosphatase PAP2 family protein, partial [Solirubrobacteraceae bacterium]
MERRPATAALAAFACLCGLALTGLVALLLPVAQVGDSATLGGFTALSVTDLGGIALRVAHLVDPRPYLVAAGLLAAVAVLRRRPRVALLVPVAMIGASATSELLKPLVAQPRFSEWLGSGSHILAASWPSGHATASMMIALCAVLVAPPALRPLAALLGTGLAVGVSYSILVLGWHFPSDVLGGFLVAGTWTSAAVAILWGAEARWPARSGREAVRRATGA